MKAHLYCLILLAALAFVASCSEDDPARPSGNGGTQAFQPLTSREAVLNNLELGWVKRNAGEIDDLLDENFTFYFAPGDVGGEIPASWNRAAELAATTALFTSNQVQYPTGPVCRSIRVDLLFDDDLTWTEVPIPVAAYGEVWYTATVPYTHTFEMLPDNTYIAVPGAGAELTVRQVEGGEWRLVVWRDLESTIVASSAAPAEEAETTWGGIKALYR